LLVLAPRLAEVDVHVDETGRDDEPLGVDRPIRLLRDLPDLLDLRPVDEDVERFPALDEDQAFTCDRRRSTAARIATPFDTWLRMTEWLLSAASPEISSPRFMGPGCMMIVPFWRVARRSRVSPKNRMYSEVEGKRPAC